MAHRPEDLKQRFQAFTVTIAKVCDQLPRTPAAGRIAAQLVDAAGSAGANYRAACRGRSRAEFLAKLGIVEEEADEAAYWLAVLVDAGLLDAAVGHSLCGEANELVAITVASIRTARANSR